MAEDATRLAKAFHKTGGDAYVIANGGELLLEAGSKVRRQAVVTKGASFTVLASQSGTIFIATAADVVFTLPSTAVGLFYTFVQASLSSGTGMSISPAAADNFDGAADNKDWQNTGATDVLGDSITIVGDGSIGWYTIASNGIWVIES